MIYRHPLFTLSAVLLGLGAIFFALAATKGMNYYSFAKNANLGQGIVADVERRQEPGGSYSDYPLIHYTTREGEVKTFQSSIGTGKGLYKKDQHVEVYYTDSEARMKGGSELQLYSVFGAVGFVMLTIGVAVSVHVYKRHKDITWLQQYGQKIETQLVNIKRITWLKINGRAPYVLVSRGAPPGKESMLFKSDMLGFRPQVDLNEKIMIPVFVDPENSKRYYVNTAFLDIH